MLTALLPRRTLSSALAFARQLSSLVLVDLRPGVQSTPGVSGDAVSALQAARQLGDPVTLLVAGHGAAASDVAAAAARLEGVKNVLLADHPALDHQLAEPYARLVQAVQKKFAFTHIWAPGNSFGKNVLPRAAALLGVQPVSDVTRVVDTDTFVRPVYAGNAFATVKYNAGSAGPRMLTVRTTSFPVDAPAADASRQPVAVEPLPAEDVAAAGERDWGVTWVGQDLTTSDRPELGAAKVVVCGGRALKSADNFKMLERVADILGGAVGASRAAVDAGYVANDLQVGQTGKVVAPDLYIGVGISGAIQHLAGMKDSRTIVAINTDSEAPIFQVSDYGLVQDLFTALPALEQELLKAKAAKA